MHPTLPNPASFSTSLCCQSERYTHNRLVINRINHLLVQANYPQLVKQSDHQHSLPLSHYLLPITPFTLNIPVLA